MEDSFFSKKLFLKTWDRRRRGFFGLEKARFKEIIYKVNKGFRFRLWLTFSFV